MQSFSPNLWAALCISSFSFSSLSNDFSFLHWLHCLRCGVVELQLEKEETQNWLNLKIFLRCGRFPLWFRNGIICWPREITKGYCRTHQGALNTLDVGWITNFHFDCCCRWNYVDLQAVAFCWHCWNLTTDTYRCCRRYCTIKSSDIFMKLWKLLHTKKCACRSLVYFLLYFKVWHSEGATCVKGFYHRWVA